MRILSTADLERVEECTRIDGDLDVRFSGLEHMDGLSNLADLGGDITIADGSFQQVDGLSGLEPWCGEDLEIRNNDLLEQVEGLSGHSICIYSKRICATKKSQRLWAVTENM